MKMKEDGIPLDQRLKTFPWLLLDLVFPFMMEHLLSVSPPLTTLKWKET